MGGYTIIELENIYAGVLYIYEMNPKSGQMGKCQHGSEQGATNVEQYQVHDFKQYMTSVV